MKTISVVEAKASFSALLAAVQTGEEVCISKHGRVIARLIPEQPRMAIDAFRVFWSTDTDASDDVSADVSDWVAPSDELATQIHAWDVVD